MRPEFIVFGCIGMAFGVLISGAFLYDSGKIDELVFAGTVTVAIVLMFAILVITRAARVSLAGGGIVIKSPFSEIMIPYEMITGAEFRQTFSPGLRVYGYGSIHRKTGLYKNGEFGRYRIAMDSRITGFVVVRYRENGVFVFNCKDGQTTYSMFTEILSKIKKE